MLEKHLENGIRDLCKRLDAKRYHVLRSEGSTPGFPDDVIVRGDLLCFWELKSDRGKPSKEQLDWLEALRNIRRIDVRVLRPADLQLAADILTGRKRP